MTVRRTRKQVSSDSATSLVVPSGAPSWVTPELLEKTVKVWQPYYEEELIPEDALAIIMGVGRIFEFLADGHSDETIRRPCSRQQP